MQSLSDNQQAGNTVTAPRFAGAENVAQTMRAIGTCVYAVLFSDGWVKVGRGRCGKSRINSHSGLSAMRGATVVRSIISGRLVDSKSAESKLIAYCTAAGTLAHGREWFSNVDFERLVEIIETRFQGDSADAFILAHAKRDAMNEELASAMLDQKTSTQDDAKWAASLQHARVMNRMYTSDMYGGDMFTIDSRTGLNLFTLYAAIAIYELDEEGLAYTYCHLATDPYDGINTIFSLADEAIDAYRKNGVL